MTHNAENDVTDWPCPSCGAAVGTPCIVRLSGVDTTGWAHDARIMAPVYADIRARVTRIIPPAKTGGDDA